jgi:acetyltransferase-like isoleucine patch superfamily enzyme
MKFYTALLRGSAGAIGNGTLICPPLQSFNIKEMHVGNNSRISEHCWIQCINNYQGREFAPELKIGDDVHIGRFAHIIACDKMKIGNGVVIAERVYISDNLHGFEDLDSPIMQQPLKQPGPVIIEDEVWIGNGACILPNVTIGKHSIIGSNAVVTKDIPPYCVAAGVPAKIIKQYNPQTEKWEKVK